MKITMANTCRTTHGYGPVKNVVGSEYSRAWLAVTRARLAPDRVLNACQCHHVTLIRGVYHNARVNFDGAAIRANHNHPCDVRRVLRILPHRRNAVKQDSMNTCLDEHRGVPELENVDHRGEAAKCESMGAAASY